MTNLLRVALAQVETTSDPAQNQDKAGACARQAASRGADLLVLPEMFMGAPGPDLPPAEIANRDGGRFWESMGRLAKVTGIHIAAGGWEAIPGEQRVYNTVITFSPQGERVAAYRKIHLFDALSVRESDTMAPGDDLPPVVAINGVRVGFAICYDLRFPEFFRYLAQADAQLIVIPSAWYQGPVKETHWLTLLQARAIENTLYVAGCNLVGPSFCGRSAIFDPFGIPIAAAGEVENLVVGEIDVERIAAVRQKLPALGHRRMKDGLKL
ncbi:carbon-nitrogen hydrolase family protein [Desulfatitalea alkaliphila]|uniref:Carbon-nitrogen hydrolase family protein n=1 Tax=Desulfatitalea alkaliphila TaxID=2929485 RepID=A0AA41R745_9BACT|nr:carbon-nitrogen hydrolase family protein [Desulfatitalea alkaliphila]MCJ8502683.1 carbon-nitrogen hydrolase family protein [Desulfatitalea alkaliphila]